MHQDAQHTLTLSGTLSGTLPRQNVIDLCEQAWRQAVNRVHGAKAVALALEDEGCPYPFTHCAVLAVGKAACSMLQGVYDAGITVTTALVVTKYAHSAAALLARPEVDIIESGHPVPDQQSLVAGRAAQDFVAACTGPLLVLVSGGASALLESLPKGYTLTQLQKQTEASLAAGLDIAAINRQRATVSQVKAGKLLAACPASRIDSLLISDVEGDDPAVIGSGIGLVPARPECRLKIIASNQDACQAAARYLADYAPVQYPVQYCASDAFGDIDRIAESMVAILQDGEPGWYIFGGETTVVLPDAPGEGGRNQAMALKLAMRLQGREDIVGLVAGTDGTDGPTDAAGGWFGRMPIHRTHCQAAGQTQAAIQAARQADASANAGAWLREHQQLFISGPTGTNVMDVMIVAKGLSL